MHQTTPAQPAASPRHVSAAENLMELIEGEVRAVALSFGVPASEAMVSALLDRLTLRLGAAPLYLPRTDPRKRQQRNAAIRAAFNGRNAAELARQHGISLRRVQQIVGKA